MCQEVEMKVGKQPVALDTGEEVLPLTRPKEEDMVAQKPGKDIPMGKSSAISKQKCYSFDTNGWVRYKELINFDFRNTNSKARAVTKDEANLADKHAETQEYALDNLATLGSKGENLLTSASPVIGDQAADNAMIDDAYDGLTTTNTECQSVDCLAVALLYLSSKRELVSNRPSWDNQALPTMSTVKKVEAVN
jgi:hypothetical protein